MTVEIFLSHYQSVVNGAFRIFFQLDVQFSVELFLCCSTVVVCIYTILLLLCVFGNGMEMGITQQESHGNGNKTNLEMGMGM